MTNNPTIDGVSRELLANAANYMEGSVSAQVNIWCRELRTLLDAKDHPCPVLLDGCDGSCAPAVELQEVSELGAMRRLAEDSCNELVGRSLEHANKVAALQSTIAQLEDKLNKAIDLDFQRRETIDTLTKALTDIRENSDDIGAFECASEALNGERK